MKSGRSIMNMEQSHTRPGALLAIAATAVGMGGFIGATTNAVGGAVSPLYFQNVLGWGEIENIWRAAVAQGIFEGLMYGLFFSVVFTLVVGIVSRAQCAYTSALRYLFSIMAGVYGCWVLGGLIGTGLAVLSPEFFQRTFADAPDRHAEMLRFAWVGGSIWGAVAGGVLAMTIGCILFGVRWKRAQRADFAT
jgi:hypothetical protein